MKITLSAILPLQASEACCTCATALCKIPKHSIQIEKPYADGRRLQCCSRVICGSCIHENSRFASYCPFCQVTSAASSSMMDPPSYDCATSDPSPPPPPPPYYTCAPTPGPHAHLANDQESKDKDRPTPPDTLHFVHPFHDSIPSLSLRYRVPAAVLRRYNKLTSDHLLSARRTILVPGSHYPSAVSLSPRPVGGEEEEVRKAKIRRWMVACKCADYDTAELYLDQDAYDLRLAQEKYFADVTWEQAHPLESGRRSVKANGNGITLKGKGAGTWAAVQAALHS